MRNLDKEETATESFNRHYDNSQKLLKEVSIKIERFKEEQKDNQKDWGYAGSMEHIEELLEQINEFLGPSV